MKIRNQPNTSLHSFLCACLLSLLVGCSGAESASTGQEPIIYSSLDELLFDPQFSVTPADGVFLEAIVDMPSVDMQDLIIGILYNPIPESEFCQFFGAQVVEDGYLLNTLSEKLSAQSDYGFSMDFFDGAYTVHFAIGETELSSSDQFLASKELTNGKTIKIGLSLI